jgi:pimeloyl-ACP methyl ester carboxylesterase
VQGGCLAPPALLPAYDVDLDKAIERFPPGTERVELPLASGERLRGVFVPSDAGAPVVLHLLESSGSVASCRFDYAELSAELADIGFASLVIDYRGIGISGGDRSVDHLEDDSLAMWNEALRRAGGDPKRVVVRGVSMGTIGTAYLLHRGLRPRAIVQIAPVVAKSVVERFARMMNGAFLGLVARAFYRPAADVDLAHEIREAGVPVFLVSGNGDPLLDEDDRRALGDAAWQGGGGLFRRAGDHLLVAIEAHSLLREERPLYAGFLPESPSGEARAGRLLDVLPEESAARFAPGSEARERLIELSKSCMVGDPLLLAAAALANENGESAARMVWLRRADYQAGRELEDLAAELSLEDPAGALPIDLVEEYSLPLRLPRRHGGLYCMLETSAIVHAAFAKGLGRGGGSWSSSILFSGGPVLEVRSDPERLMVALRARGLGESDARRQFVRILMKVYGIPDRLTRAQDGALVLEAREEDRWRVLDLSTPPPDEPYGVHMYGTLKL